VEAGYTVDFVVHAHRFILESLVGNFGAWNMPTSKNSRIVERFTCAENRNRFWNRDPKIPGTVRQHW
jgi:hypothetical protein